MSVVALMSNIVALGQQPSVRKEEAEEAFSLSLFRKSERGPGAPLPLVSWLSWTEKTGFSLEEWRESIATVHLKEFNRADFFLAVQIAIAIYYPAVALSILYQYYGIEMALQQTESCESQFIERFDSQNMQSVQPTQSLTQWRSMIIRLMEQLVNAQSSITDQRRQIQFSVRIKTAAAGGEAKGDGVEARIRAPGHGEERQQNTGEGRQHSFRVWCTLDFAI